jgi:hypothetical protein
MKNLDAMLRKVEDSKFVSGLATLGKIDSLGASYKLHAVSNV